MSKKTKYAGWILVVLVLSAITFLVYRNQVSRTLVRRPQDIVTEWEGMAETPSLRPGKGELTQQVKLAYGRVQSLRTILIMDGEEEEGELILRIYEQNGASREQVAEGKTELDLHKSGDIINIKLDAALQYNRTYTYAFTVEGEENSPLAVRLLLAGEAAVDQVGAAAYDGEALNGSLEMSNRYLTTNMGHFWLVLVADAAILLLCLIGPWVKKKLYRYRWVRHLLSTLLWLMTSPVIFYFTQRIVRWKWKYRDNYILWVLLFYLLVHILFSALARKVKIGSALYSIALSLLALTSYFVMAFRGKPLLFFDITAIGTAATVAGDYHYTIAVQQALALLICLTWVILIVIFQEAEFPKKKKGWISRGLLFGLSLLSLVAFDHYKLQRGWLDGHDFWKMNSAYMKKGFLPTLLAQAHYIKVDPPEGYSVEKVEEAGKAAQEAYDADPDNVQPEVTPTNIIVIMNESFWDPTTMGRVETGGEELLPYWHSLEQQEGVTSGALYMPVFGAGTANSEYEVLTGNSKHFLPMEVTAYETYVADPEYGMASTLKAQGYETFAVHPNVPTAWNRGKVYPWMSFDTFLNTDNWMGEYRMVHDWISDSSAYEQIMDKYDQKKAGDKLFTFCVTIQNHGGYAAEDAAGYQPTVSLYYNTDYPLAETYLSLIQESDAALKELIDHFSETDEPTMIVMFGDHQPKIEGAFYNELKNTGAGTVRVPNEESKYVAPYMIWTNYERQGQQNMDMSANYLGAYILQQAGVELTTYDKFLLETMKKLPVIGVTRYQKENRRWRKYAKMTDEEKEILQTYRCLQYNNVNDRKNRVDTLFQ